MSSEFIGVHLALDLLIGNRVSIINVGFNR